MRGVVEVGMERPCGGLGERDFGSIIHGCPNGLATTVGVKYSDREPCTPRGLLDRFFLMTRLSRRVWWKLLIAGGLVPVIPGPGWSDDKSSRTESTPGEGGFEPGDAVPNFYVRAVTGPLQGKSVCYVCRNGDRPVIMVLARQMIPRLDALLRELDRLIDAHRADGLRGFGVFVGPDSRKLLPQVQTLAFENKLILPLTLAAAPAEGPGLRGLPPEVAVSVVLYRNQKVFQSFRLANEAIDDKSFESIVDAVQTLAQG